MTFYPYGRIYCGIRFEKHRKGLVCIFFRKNAEENRGSPPSSWRRQCSSALHLTLSSPFRDKNKREARRPLFFTYVRKPTSHKGMPSFLHGLSHGLKIARPLSIFAPVCALVSPFRVPSGPKTKERPEGLSSLHM